ncbi:MAG: glycerophosphodiester phosphodiesterase [Anaerolineae bacterium]|nr:glycerophosphodiester phosphodiesterase [Anaerolineae bacterium]
MTSPILPPDQRPNWDSLLPMPESRISDRKPIIIGHRGAQGLAPENTLAAFQTAIDLKIDGVEFDVQRTQDGELVVIHDDEVDRTTDGSGRVWDLTLAQIKALDAGGWFDARFRGERVPTLREVFGLLRDTDLLLFVELKDPWRFEGIEADVIALIREYGLVERAQLRSFYHAALHTAYRVDPGIALSELWFDRLPADNEITLKTVNALHALYTPEHIQRLHDRGIQVTAWTVDEVDEARRLIEAGIDGLTTNFPDRLLRLF